MDPLGAPLTTRPIQTWWEICIELYPNCRFVCVDNIDHHFGNDSVWTRNRTRCDGPELLLTLDTMYLNFINIIWTVYRMLVIDYSLMKSVVAKKYRDVTHFHNIIVGCELYYWQLLNTIILLIINKFSKILFFNCIDYCTWASSMRVKCSWQSSLNFQFLHMSSELWFNRQS
jgi:hypothetical protein